VSWFIQVCVDRFYVPETQNLLILLISILYNEVISTGGTRRVDGHSATNCVRVSHKYQHTNITRKSITG